MLIKLLTPSVIKEIELANLNAMILGFLKTPHVYVSKTVPPTNMLTYILVVVFLLVTVFNLNMLITAQTNVYTTVQLFRICLLTIILIDVSYHAQQINGPAILQ